ncbi:hypothetical protein [Paenibacillus sp.]|uniref:glycan biosynthesis hexose transferase WsfD n=1 Tax=Paenibacillus sp. TaxID=58172 RepID=UPI002D589558|nr:hypothetical protein [Paenibacillus sp.]HZG88401.1 hypothetical protein [Paenibacillus sp.]
MKTRTEAAALAALAAFCLLRIYLGIAHEPMIGMANNGDFERVMATAGIGYPSGAAAYADKYFGYAIFEYANVPWGFGGYPSTHLLFLFAAKVVNAALFGGDAFRIAALGAVYGVCLAAAISVIYTGLSAARPLRLAIAAALAFLFTDVGYVAYFHSLYGEPASLLGFLFAIGFALHARRGSRTALTLFAAAAILCIGAKAQNAPLAAAFAALPLLAPRPAGTRGRRAALAAAAAVLLAGAAMYAAAPKELKRINLYQTVFYGILKHSDDVAADLRELGLPEELAPLAGTNYFEAGTAIPQSSPRLTALFYDRIGHGDVLRYYAANPLRFVERLARAAEHSTTIRPYYVGSYAKEAGKPAGAVHLEGAWWSEWKRANVPASAPFAAAVALAYAALASSRRACARAGLDPACRAPLLAVPCVAAIAYVTPILGDGDADLAKHLFLYNAAFDFMAATGAALLAAVLARTAAAAAKRRRRAASRTA